ncbi:MAG: hypothetical protein A2537_01100 [Candidatus Magasanikbacteria bacterium RIFOXYD2_FULL_36_9]|uniref:Baseplate protein J-like domain-containing protein n=1 Tax=Candidatus Magasanikbacteria bacterium RIFOXYD2_FULL_36_9 TaxID=1798707 RepID=A0A1F6NYP4_9BACT|nr:MAG: hypothetical protein A2537_01100 [Candidatus Magasanikbacteria bacterium RIFOXYD2_FULL_36_9]
MRVRHTETRAKYSEPSVNFYRTIALSFLVITIALLAVVVFVTSKKATITILAKEDTRSVNLAVGLTSGDSIVDNNTIVGTVSSSIINFSQKYYPTGSKTIEGIAGGEVVVYNKTNESQVLVKTTRLVTDKGILFRLSDKITVPANGQVSATVYADKSGIESDIGPSNFTIPGLATDKQKVVYAVSLKSMDTGVRKVGILTEDDIKAASKNFEEKIKEQFAVISSDENIKNVVTVTGANPKSDKKIGEEIDGFNLSGTSTVVIISYNKKSLNDVVSKVVSSKVDNTLEKVLTVTNDPKVVVSSYDAVNKTAQLSVSQDVLVTLDANAEKLSPQYFMNKSKDDIERYVFELNHVAGVEVVFSPSWISKAPTVPDKIKVIVKNVK